MQQLYPLLPFNADETPVSWATRLAAFHIHDTLDAFTADMGLDPLALQLGDPMEIDRLCSLTGQKSARVLRNAIRYGKRKTAVLRGEHFISEIRPPDEICFCPACLLQDDRKSAMDGRAPAVWRKERLIWRLSCVRVCPVHGIPLIRRNASDQTGKIATLSDLAPEDRMDMRALCATSTRRGPSELQDYVVARLSGQSGPPHLDALPLEAVIRQTEMIGTALSFGPQASFQELSESEKIEVCDEGWSEISTSDAAIAELVEDLIMRHDLSPDVGVGRRIWSTFGVLVTEVENLPANAPLRQSVQDHVDSMNREHMLRHAG